MRQGKVTSAVAVSGQAAVHRQCPWKATLQEVPKILPKKKKSNTHLHFTFMGEDTGIRRSTEGEGKGEFIHSLEAFLTDGFF